MGANGPNNKTSISISIIFTNTPVFDTASDYYDRVVNVYKLSTPKYSSRGSYEVYCYKIFNSFNAYNKPRVPFV